MRANKNDLPEETRALVSILAAVDVLFAPMRTTFRCGVDANRNDAEVFHRRIGYVERRGLHWTVGGGVADRQAGGRLLRRLADANLLLLDGDERRRFVKLTVLGDDVARQVSGLYTRFAAWPTFTAIARAIKERRGAGLWILERQLLPPQPTPEQIRDNEIALSPFLSAGWLGSTRDTRGEQFFMVEPAGWRAVAGPRPALTPGLDFSEPAGQHYNSQYRKFRETRDSWQPDGNHVFIPFAPKAPRVDWIPIREPQKKEEKQ
jgi:hypothetical protein